MTPLSPVMAETQPVVIEPRTPSPASPPRSRRSKTFVLFALAILAVFVALAFGNAAATEPWCDEAWLSNPALTFLRSGSFGTPILTPFGWGPPQSLLHIQQRTYWIMPLHTLAQVGWYRVFGYSLLSLRSLSIFWGALALCALAAIVWQLTRSRAAALLSMLLAGTDYFLLTRAADGRMDIMAASFMLCAIAAYLHLRQRSLARASAIGGLFAAASLFTHPVGGFFSLCALAFFALSLDRKRIRIRHLVLFSLPFLLIGAAWGFYVAQDFPAFRAQMAGNAAGRWTGVTDPIGSIRREIYEKYLPAFGLNDYAKPSVQYLRLVALFLYLFALAAAFSFRSLRNRRGVRPLLGLLALFMIAGMAFDGAKRWYYLVYVVPLFVALLAISVVWLADRRLLNRRWLFAAVTAFVLVQVGGTAYRIRKNAYAHQYLPAAEFVRSHDREHASVIGSGELGFALGFPPYLVDDVSLGYFSGAKPKLIFVPTVLWGLWLDNLPQRAPRVGNFVRETLRRDYRLAYEQPTYRIYERTSGAGVPSSGSLPAPY